MTTAARKTFARKLKARLSTVPYPYQVEGVQFLEQADGCALIADDMGLGKTLQAIGWIAMRIRKLIAKGKKVLCVVPASMKWKWKREFRKHADLKAEVLEGRTPYTPRRSILIANYEILDAWQHKLKALGVAVIVMDECHYVSNRQAKRTKACRAVAKTARHRIALSGTPISNAPAEFYPVLEMIAPQLFPSWWEYAFEYCDPQKGFRGQWDFRGASNLKKLHRKISPFMIRRLKSEVLKDLPKKRRIIIPVDIANRKEYRSARENFIEWLKDKKGAGAAMRARSAQTLVQLGYLKRLAAKGKIRLAIEWIENFLAESNRKLVVFAIHTEILDALKKHFPKAAVVTGKTKPKDRLRAEDRFNKTKACRLFIGQLKAAGEGLTLTGASTTLTLEIAWNEAKHLQAEDRTLRIGQRADSCENYYMIGQDTIEEWLLEVIQAKQIVVDKVLEGEVTSGRSSLLKLLERVR